ncbi:hypothetical protein D3C87_915710 [compost metagenome]
MPRNPGDALDFKHTLGWNFLPLGHGLGSDAPKSLREGSRAAYRVLGFFADVFHTHMKAYLSQKRKHLFR